MSRSTRVNPRDDVEFVALVDRLARTAAGPDELQEHLRETHPAVVVRARDLSGEDEAVWYVYRDGAWTGPGPDSDRPG